LENQLRDPIAPGEKNRLGTAILKDDQECAPVVCIVAAMLIPAEWLVPVLVAHWFNPWAGSGI
jgi:hypothetical protein